MSSAPANYFCKLLPIEALYYIFEYMTEKEQLKFALTCSWLYRVFRIYHVGYALPKWYPLNIIDVHKVPSHESTEITERENVPNAPPAANYRDGALLNGKLYLTIFEEESPVCWILDFEVIPLSWKRVKVTFVEFESEDDNESSDDTEDKKLDLVPEIETHYQPLRSTAAAAISSMIYFFGGECLTGEPTGTLYVLDPIKMVLKKVMGQGGDIPSARKLHSLNAIGTQCLVLFGGRCLMNDSDNPKEYDIKEFHVYDISTKIWTMYRGPYDHVPYARCLHSVTVLEYTLYIYGGQQITSSTPESRIHDDDDLWCFTFNSPQQEDSIDEGQNTPEESSTSSKGSNGSRISSSFQLEKWQQIFSPRNNTSLAFSSGIGGEWHTTTGNNVGRRCGAAMFNVGKRVAVLGGFERNNWNRDYDRHDEEERRENQREVVKNPWELCKLYIPDKKRWDQVKIADFPEMECIAINMDHKGIFVMGRKRGDIEEQEITMGWIREELSNV
ncbi:hypothetical protein RclHR1_02000001 [Rhizophagus clarus]|uniref:Kelch domain-containing protein 1-like n=1 Tax=Rhizophagus clarus TaxID=94130 RepID=A0A2Z6QQR6_9GLOM|nr:hypothetical protein RclHR1_02000001 [Rhizophagus clarus]GES77470.1 kelch domain-containing protein 1-like [Rhizophagus clarus]